MQIQRRTFLGSISTAALAAASSEATAATPAASATWDVSWTERLKARHRAVFDSTEFSGGAGLLRAIMWKRQYKEVYGTPLEDMDAVLVLRAQAVWLVMNDTFWKDYAVGEKHGFKDDAGQFLQANPIASASASGKPGAADRNIPAFIAAGNIVLACHMAFGGVVAHVRKVDKLASDEEAEKKAMTFVLPGVIMQPSGVFATLRAQEAGCSYILAS